VSNTLGGLEYDAGSGGPSADPSSDWAELEAQARVRLTPWMVVLGLGVVVVVACFALSMIAVVSGHGDLSVGSIVASLVFGAIVGGALTGLFFMVHTHGTQAPLAVDGLPTGRRRAVWRGLHSGTPSTDPLLASVEEQLARSSVVAGLAGARTRVAVLLAEAVLLLFVGLTGGLSYLVYLVVAVLVLALAGTALWQQRRAVHSGGRYLAAIGAPEAVPVPENVGRRSRARR